MDPPPPSSSGGAVGAIDVGERKTLRRRLSVLGDIDIVGNQPETYFFSLSALYQS
jgi:hypothetical protein